MPRATHRSPTGSAASGITITGATMNPLVIQLIAALITASPDLLQAVAALIKAAHGQALTTDEHTELGRATATVVAPKPAA